MGEGELFGVVGGRGLEVAHGAVGDALIAPPGKEVVGGEVWFVGKNLLKASGARMREIRGDASR